jgi:hypothetical protein
VRSCWIWRLRLRKPVSLTMSSSSTKMLIINSFQTCGVRTALSLLPHNRKAHLPLLACYARRNLNRAAYLLHRRCIGTPHPAPARHRSARSRMCWLASCTGCRMAVEGLA